MAEAAIIFAIFMEVTTTFYTVKCDIQQNVLTEREREVTALKKQTASMHITA
jgi:hypothetical protein